MVTPSFGTVARAAPPRRPLLGPANTALPALLTAILTPTSSLAPNLSPDPNPNPNQALPGPGAYSLPASETRGAGGAWSKQSAPRFPKPAPVAPATTSAAAAAAAAAPTTDFVAAARQARLAA